jgi:hypothetical protein
MQREEKRDAERREKRYRRREIRERERREERRWRENRGRTGAMKVEEGREDEKDISRPRFLLIIAEAGALAAK